MVSRREKVGCSAKIVGPQAGEQADRNHKPCEEPGRGGADAWRSGSDFTIYLLRTRRRGTAEANWYGVAPRFVRSLLAAES